MQSLKPTPRRLALIACCALLALLALPWRPALAQPSVLYDAALGGTPDGPGQGMQFTATDQLFQSPPVAATQSYVEGLTELRTDLALGDLAGYTAVDGRVPALDRTAGFTLTFRLQLVAEQHTSQNRAGFSVLILDAESRGIELAFWPDRVSAQSDNPLFTRAEEVSLDTSQLISYELALRGDSYTLRGGGATLSGPLRNYQASPRPVYSLANFVFLGDNTSSAGGRTRIAYVAVEPAGAPPTVTPSVMPTATARPPGPTATTGPGASHMVALPFVAGR